MRLDKFLKVSRILKRRTVSKELALHQRIEVNGKIVKTGGFELIEKIDQQGYDFVKEELGIEIEEEKNNKIMLESCAHKGH